MSTPWNNRSCGTLPCSSSTTNTTTRTTIGGFTIKYGGSAGPNDYSTLTTRFHNDIVGNCDNWALNLDYFVRNFRGGAISWIGHIGTFSNTRCSYHQVYKAWDLNHIRFTDGTYLDFVRSAESWNSTTLSKRRMYWAIDASLQRYFNATIDAVSDPTDHYNHIHVDLSCGSVVAPYTPWLSVSDDTKYIQRLCNDFNSAGLTVDGKWGNNTTTAWNALLSKLGMTCINPLTSATHWKVFLSYIMRHGLTNRAAGYWKYGC